MQSYNARCVTRILGIAAISVAMLLSTASAWAVPVTPGDLPSSVRPGPDAGSSYPVWHLVVALVAGAALALVAVRMAAWTSRHRPTRLRPAI